MPFKKPMTSKQRSPELGDGDFGITYNTKTGRPVRKSTAKTDSPFVDSAIALSDEEPEPSDEEDDLTSYDEDEDIVTKQPVRKRTYSPSPPLSDLGLSEPDDALSDVSSDASDDETEQPLCRLATRKSASSSRTNLPPLQVTLNVPAGEDREITLNIDLKSLLMRQASPKDSSSPPARKRQKLLPQASKSKSSTKETSSRAGFLDLPPELRNEIYRLTFVTPNKDRLDFGSPSARFSRSAAFLRTCSTVHNEARSILYSENEFFFQRQSRRHGHIFASDWSELGFRPVRRFLKAIGPVNTGLIRHVTFLFEDAAPSLNPQLSTAEARRFVHDPQMHSLLRHLGAYAKLRVLHMNFQGRKTVDAARANDKFLSLLIGVKADEVEFVRHPVWATQSSYHSKSKHAVVVGRLCSEGMVRRKKMFPSAAGEAKTKSKGIESSGVKW
ncbi:hypothetical protein B0A48_12278 [Cryoendolithus antarcticus]|uniref:F-box domain-containing protein n=1 Tax=Cryoendolithus antarcticus TaxID=1507870 RepID=A0A1V8SRK2_9PEZI|nr:hypothetical protein B0A48_12278 [Cryoendolithus antarcticus]